MHCSPLTKTMLILVFGSIKGTNDYISFPSLFVIITCIFDLIVIYIYQCPVLPLCTPRRDIFWHPAQLILGRYLHWSGIKHVRVMLWSRLTWTAPVAYAWPLIGSSRPTCVSPHSPPSLSCFTNHIICMHYPASVEVLLSFHAFQIPCTFLLLLE